jgi:hypothetical protein
MLGGFDNIAFPHDLSFRLGLSTAYGDILPLVDPILEKILHTALKCTKLTCLSDN